MAQIRIVDAWLRSPASPPVQYRSVMVIAEKWAEQRVLMRAYAESRDQTLPTIMLHGTELAIGPAGVDVHGAWGIHVGEPRQEGAAQAIKQGLEEAARRLAGSKGNPPRLADEEPTFEREPTANWAPGTPRILPRRPDTRTPRPPAVDYVAPTGAARVPQVQAATYVPKAQSAPAAQMAAPSNPDQRLAPVSRARGKTRPPPVAVRTALGYTSGSGAQSAIVRLGLSPRVSARLGRYVDRIVPADFTIDAAERRVLDALGEAEMLDARALGHLLDVVDPVAFMEELQKKLEAFGLGDLVEPAEPRGGEPTYRLRR